MFPAILNLFFAAQRPIIVKIHMRTLAILLLAAASAAAQNNTLTPEEAAEGWRLLFDGKTMNGWADPSKKDPPGDAWIIDDGCLKTVRGARISEDLLTEESFGNFELKLDWRVSPGGNTGVKYRIQNTVFVDPARNPPDPRGFEAWLGHELANKLSKRSALGPKGRGQEYSVAFELQLIDDERHPDAKRGNDRITGALYGMVAPARRAPRSAGDWNSAKLVVYGDRVEHWINGIVVLQSTLDCDEVRFGVSKRWALAPSIRNALLNPKPSGPIALQYHGDVVWFRNIKIRTFE